MLYWADVLALWLIEDFIELGFNILTPLQPDVNDVTEIKKK